MSKSVVSLGVDVGQAEVWAAVRGRVPRRFAHTVAGAQELGIWAKQAAGDGCVHVCMEATGVYSRLLAVRLLAQEGITVSIVNPAQIKAFARAQLRRTKTDRVDAIVILAFAESQCPMPWTPEPQELRKLSRLVGQAEALDEDIQRWKNRRHATAYDPEPMSEVNDSQAVVLATLTSQRAAIEQAIRLLITNEPSLAADVAVLRSIKGIGPISSVQLLAYANGCLTERTGKQVTAHAGLAPAHRQSGTSVRGRSHLAKQGNKRLRTALYMPVLSAIRYNPIIREFYDRLLNRGKPKKVALAACMRKLLLIARAVLLSGKPFDPCYQPLT